MTLGLALLFCLQGIPCVYYGTEQNLQGTKKEDGTPDLGALESVREALWGRTSPAAFDPTTELYLQVQALAKVRRQEPPLRYGRLYFRQLSGDGKGFGHSQGRGGIVAFSRILVDREVLVVANTNFNTPFKGFVLVDRDLNANPRQIKVAYSNLTTQGTGTVKNINQADFYEGDRLTGTGQAAALYVELAPLEVQVLVPV